MNNEQIIEQKQQIIKYGTKLGLKNMSPGTSGNISVRAGENVLITASESCLGDLCEDEIVEIDLNTNLIGDGKKPSSEKNMHCEIYKTRPDINAIIHCHAPYLSTFAVCNETMEDAFLVDFVYYFDKIPVVPYALPGSEKLAKSTAWAFKNKDAVLLEHHGFIIGAKDLKTAYYLTETAEAAAQVYLNTITFTNVTIGDYNILSDKDVQELRNLRNFLKEKR